MTLMRNGKILRVWIDQVVDSSTDFSWIGEYANQPGKPDRTIDRQARGDRRHRELRYFVATMSGEETGNQESVEQDYQRMESYNRGDWYMVGVIAKAEFQTGRNAVVQTLRSCGLWGVESDSSADYLKGVAQEELAGLREELLAVGFDTDQVDRAFQNIEAEDCIADA